jgi:SAM-dependent methyltransferase
VKRVNLARTLADSLDRVRGNDLPPRRLLVRTSSPSRAAFRTGGLAAMECCRLGGLRPDDRVLDIGSGVGRVALPLTRYLTPAGAYRGVDMWREGVEWCERTITPRFPRFTFRHVDLYHPTYNPSGGTPITSARLPEEDDSFDFVVLGAINHLSAPELLALVGEAGRVLRPGGTYVGTWFVVDEGANVALPPGAAPVACEASVMHAALASSSLRLSVLHPGSWRGVPDAPGYQDLVVAHKVSGDTGGHDTGGHDTGGHDTGGHDTGR